MSDATWYMRDRGQKRGPFSQEKLLVMYRRGQLSQFHEISQDGKSWVKAATLLAVPTLPEPLTGTRTDGAEPPPSAPGESGGWPVATDDSALVGDRPRRKRSGTRTKRLAILAVPCVLAAIALTVATFFFTKSGTLPLPSWGGSRVISSLDDEEQIASAVGLVVLGMEFSRPDGTHGDIPLFTGSCFAISEDGYLVTNRHVVEYYDNCSRAEGIIQKKLNYARQLLSAVPPGQREEMIKKLLGPQSTLHTFNKFEPRIWVFFKGKNGEPEKWDADLPLICDESEFDFAILKINRKSGPFFRLSDVDQKMKRGHGVVALGFPGVTYHPVSAEEIEEDQRRQQVGKIESHFKDRDFIYARTGGTVSLDFAEKTGRRWIQHDAPITHGNSGGPLVDPDGLVLGINTRGEQDGSTYQSLSINQLKPKIERLVPRAVFASK
jgi:S1-C subfamily serine protease